MTEPDVTEPDDRRRLMYFQYVFPWKLTDHGQQQFVANVILMPNVSQISVGTSYCIQYTCGCRKEMEFVQCAERQGTNLKTALDHDSSGISM